VDVGLAGFLNDNVGPVGSGPKNTWFDLGPERLSGFGNKQGSPNPRHNCFRRSSFGV